MVRFRGTVRIGDLIAASAILVSGYGIFHSLNESRQLTQIELSNHQREAAARAIARLDRWKAVQESLQSDLQPIIVSVTETLRDSGNPERARDQFWREVHAAYASVERRVVSEQLDTGYETLLIYSPRSRQIYLDTYNRLQELSERTAGDIAEEGQQAILVSDPANFQYTAILGNALRGIVIARFQALAQSADQIGRPARIHFCRSIVTAADDIRTCAFTGSRRAAQPQWQPAK